MARLVAAGTDAIDLSGAYLSGEDLDVRLSDPLPARVDLVPAEGDWYAVPFSVAVAADRPCDLPMRIAARRVELRGLDYALLEDTALQLFAGEAIVLEDCRLHAIGDRDAGAVLRVSCADAVGRVTLRRCTLSAAHRPALRIATPGPTPVEVTVENCEIADGALLCEDGVSLTPAG